MSQLKNTTTPNRAQPGETVRIAFEPYQSSEFVLEVPGDQCAQDALFLARRLTAGMRSMLLRIADDINVGDDSAAAEEIYALAYLADSAAALISSVHRGTGGDA